MGVGFQEDALGEEMNDWYGLIRRDKVYLVSTTFLLAAADIGRFVIFS